MLEFNSIPLSILTPGSFVEFDDSRAQPSLALRPLRILIMGQMLAAGVGAPLTPYPVRSPAASQKQFGRASMVDRMIKALWKTNSTTELWAIGLDDNGAGVAATHTITVTHAPTAAGTLALYIAGTLVDVAVAATDLVADVATNIAAAINANLDLPVTAVAAAAVVTTTCIWKGLTGNDIDFRLNYFEGDESPDGLTITFAAGTAGAGNPDITAALAALGDQQYHVIAFPWTDGVNLALLATELAARRGPLQMIEGLAFSSAKGTLGQLATLGALPNSPDISISEARGPATTWERCAREAGTIAFYGGIDPARPFQTLALAGDIAPKPVERFVREDRDTLLHDGISTHVVDPGGNVLLERPITTYLVNPDGAPDAAYLDVTTMLTLGYLRYTLRARIAAKYPRHKLMDDGDPIPPGQPIVTPKTLNAELVCLARDWEAAGLVDNIDEFKSLLIVERDKTDRSRVNALIPPDIISGLRVFAGQIQFAF
jgi:phage tail sheath gpL-like